MRCPVITSSLGAQGFPVQHGVEALIAENVDQFAEALARLIGSEQLRRELGSNARAMIVQSFGWNQIGNRFLELAEEATKS